MIKSLIRKIYIKQKAKKHWRKLQVLMVYGKNFCESPSLQFRGDEKILNVKVTNLTKDKSKIKFGDNCNISASILLRERGSISVGDYVYMNGNILNIQYDLKIGSYCMFGPNVKLWDSKDHPLDKDQRRIQLTEKLKEGTIDSYLAGGGDIEIGDDVWIGMDSIILGGVTIGNGVVVAAGSIVTKSVPENVLVAGVPARIVKKI